MDTIIRNVPATPAEPLSREQVLAYLDYTYEALLSRRDELLAALALTARTKLIADGDEITAGKFTENLSMAKALLAAIKRAHEDAKRPYLDGGRAVDGWKNSLNAVIDAATTPVATTLQGFLERKDARLREEARRAAVEAQAEADKAAAIAAAALQRNPEGSGTAVKLEIAARVSEIAAAAQDAAEGKPSARGSRTLGVYGGSAGLRVNWGWEIEDFDKIPLEFLQVNGDAVDAAKAPRDARTGKPTRVIPGIRWVEQRKLGVR